MWHRCPKEKNGTAQLERNCHAIPAGFVKINLFTDHSDHTIARNGYPLWIFNDSIYDFVHKMVIFAFFTVYFSSKNCFGFSTARHFGDIETNHLIWFRGCDILYWIERYCIDIDIELRDIVLILILN